MFAKVLKVRYLAVLALMLILAASAYAFAAANTVPTSGAGDGQATISGYPVTAVHYILGSPPTNLSSMTFTMVPPASVSAPTTVQVQLLTTGSSYGCTGPTSNVWTCALTTPAVAVTNTVNLRVVAAE